MRTELDLTSRNLAAAMPRVLLTTTVALALLLGGVTTTSSASPSSGSPASADPVDHNAGGTVLVLFEDGHPRSAARAIHDGVGGRRVKTIPRVGADVVEVDDVAAALADYRQRPGVAWAGRDGVVRAAAAPADNEFDEQWNLQSAAAHPGALNWEPAYSPGATFGEGVIVAVIDTGVGRTDRIAPDGFTKPLAPGFDYVNPGTPPDDEDGHGTHIAGTIAQQTNNPTTTEPDSRGASVAGIAPNATIMPVRVLDAAGAGSVSDTAAGMIWAVDNGARVLNLSLSGDYSPVLCKAVAEATARGALVLAASGNESEEGIIPVGYPAACPGAVAVGGHASHGARAPYSNGSCELAVSAPGGDIAADPTGRLGRPLTDRRNGILQETVDNSPDGYGFYHDSGTSMAVAHASGLGAILMGAPYNKSAEEAARIIRATARDTGLSAGPDTEYGWGAADVAGAIAAATNGVPAPAERLGYWMVASDGGIFAFGDAPFYGSTGNLKLNSPIVGMARTTTGRGYWMVAADGGIFTFGDAVFYGSAGSLPLKAPIVGMTPTATGRGYWLVGADGGIFAYGDAQFAGSSGGLVLNQPIISMAATRTGRGYWLVARDGGIFAYGDAAFHGSTGSLRLNAPITGMARTPTGGGYWMFATDGGIFSFGDAAFHGSTGNLQLNKPIIAMVPTCYGKGYWLMASDGGVFTFGAATFLGSTGNITLNRPIVGALLATDHRLAQS